MTRAEVLAPGIVRFPSCFSISDEEIDYLAKETERSFNDNYEFVYDDDGQLLHGVNKSFHIVPVEHIFTVPVRIYDNLSNSFVTLMEETTHQCLLEYLKVYQDALRSVWWRTVGHVSVYQTGSSLGAHSDNDVNYRPGSLPKDQAAVQHVISSTAVLNDDFTGGNIFFEYYNLEVELRGGDALFFPSNYVGTHTVKTVTSGTRMSYVSWYGHGSPSEDRNIVPRRVEEFGYQKGKIWMDHVYSDFSKLVESGEVDGRRVFQRAYDHDD